MKSHNGQAVATAFAAAVMLAIPAVASSQGTMTAAPARARAISPVNSCMRLKSIPSPLVDTPEGLEMLKMQRELGEVRDRLIRTKADTSDPALKRVLIVRSGVDSMVRYFASGPDVASGTVTVFFRNNGGGPGMNERMVVENMIREMQPRVVEAVRGTNIYGTINVQSTAPGYLGVSTSTSTYPSVLDNTRSFGYCDYPRVETVDAGSPADKVGLTAGDTLLAYNNRDLLQFDVNYQSLLRPGQQLQIKFRRDGQTRVVSPTIAPRAESERVFVAARTSCADPRMRAECEAPQQVLGRSYGPPVPMMGGNTMAVAAQGFPTGSIRPAQIPSILFPTDRDRAWFGGANLKVITEAVAKTSGGAAGMLVLDVREGTPSHAAGIREGETIVAANGSPVRDVNGFSNALAPKMSEHFATLQLSSSAGLRTVTIRW